MTQPTLFELREKEVEPLAIDLTLISHWLTDSENKLSIRCNGSDWIAEIVDDNNQPISASWGSKTIVKAVESLRKELCGEP